MHWKSKAYLHRFFASLPHPVGNALMYALQSRAGQLKQLAAEPYVHTAREYLDYIQRIARPIAGASFLEVGTGRRLTTALALWLCGANRVVSVDLNRYYKPTIFMKDMQRIASSESRIRELLGRHASATVFDERITLLQTWLENPHITPGDILLLTGIEYLAPADASQIDLPDGSIDYHVSVTVFEHIPPKVLGDILMEARRLLRPKGLLVHYIDYSDHFAFVDASIPRVHFLQFTEREWERWAGNRFAYHNRLRKDDFRMLFEQAGFRFLLNKERVDSRSLAMLENGSLPVTERFAGKSSRVNATTDAWVVARAIP